MSAATATLDQADAWRPAVNPWIIALTVTLATFMEVLDTSIANVALPHIAGSSVGRTGREHLGPHLVSRLERDRASAERLAFIHYRPQEFLHGLCGAFYHQLVLCAGLRRTWRRLIICRVLQGAGGGGLQPSEQAILADTFPPAKRGMAFAVYGMAVVTAPAIGPTLGGWITDNFTWRWIFFINIPVGILSILLTSR